MNAIRRFVSLIGLLAIVVIVIGGGYMLFKNVEFGTVGARAADLPGEVSPDVSEPTVDAAATVEVPVNWTQVPLARYFDTFVLDETRWVLPLGTHYATDLSNGRYEAVESKPIGGNAGWCGRGQLDCPAHLGLYRAEVSDDVAAIMDIATRIMVTADHGGKFHFELIFNHSTRSDAELMDDYTVAASDGQLGLFIATLDPSMMPATLAYLGDEYDFGYGCWDCLAHTSGMNAAIVGLDDPSIGHFGEETPTLGDSLYPAYVIPIPSPEEDPDFAVDLTVTFPEGTNVVLWFGRYDVPTQ